MVEPTTHEVYEHMLNKHIYPYFKSISVTLSKATPALIQKYYTDKLCEGLSPNTVIKHHAVIRTALQQAVETKLIKENVCDLAKKPKRTTYRGNFYNAGEINTLLAIVKGTSIETAIYMAAFFGLRRSEVLGLRWDAVDFDSGTMLVNHKVVRAKKDGKLMTHASDDLKTDASYRALPLNESLLTYLQNLKETQDANRERNGNCHIHKYDAYICVNELGDLLNPDYVSDVFGRIIKQNGLKHIRFHDLRHSCASLLLALGYSMKEVQEWLGHANFQTTANLYSHVDPKRKRDMIEGLGSALTI
jgi:integrase